MYPNVTHTLSFANEASNEGDLETLAQEEVEEVIQTPWRLILYNDEVHTFEEVIQQLIKALKCGRGPFLIFAAFANKTDAGGVLRIKV